MSAQKKLLAQQNQDGNNSKRNLRLVEPLQSKNPTPTPQKRKFKPSMFIWHVVLVALSVFFLWFAFTAMTNSIKLSAISKEITDMEQTYISQDPEDPKNIRYQKLLGDREEVRDSSWVGWLLVQSGTNNTTKAIRAFSLIAIYLLSLPSIYCIVHFVHVDGRYFYRKYIAKRSANRKSGKK